MLQLVAVDLDGTLANYDAPIKSSTIKLLQQLQNEGVQLVLASGKPASYVAGLVRQTNLKNVIIVGDNGGVIWYNHAFPPKDPFVMEVKSAAIEEMRQVREAIIEKFNDQVWIQPNQVTYSLFGRGIDIIEVYAFCDQIFKEKEIKLLKNFKTGGALDIIPCTMDKGVALQIIQEKMNIPIEDTATIGDGSNDVPMFLRGKIRITFPRSETIFKNLGAKIVPNIDSALGFLFYLAQFEKNLIMFDLGDSPNGI
ncbi:MAG: HAD family hydrolase [Candidatus Helarchaeota archaeon]